MTAKAAKAVKASPKKTKTTKSKAAAVKTDKTLEKKPGVSNKNLQAWNLRFGVVLVVLAVAVGVAGDDATLPLTTQYLANDALATEAAGHDVLATAIRHLWDVPLAWLVAKFLFVFGAFYLLYATLLRKRYEAWLERGVNNLRWVGFGLGTGVMAVTIAMLSGISDVGYLLFILASLLLLGSLSTIVELLGIGRKLRKYVIITALLTAALPVVAIGITFLGVLLYNGSVPVYLYYVYASMFLMSVAFATACILRLRKRGKWADTTYSERMFMLLGFLAPTILAMQIFAGALQP